MPASYNRKQFKFSALKPSVPFVLSSTDQPLFSMGVTSPAAGIPCTNKQKNKKSKRAHKKAFTYKADKNQAGSHKRLDSSMVASTKVMMSRRVTGVEAMSCFGSILQVGGTLTFIERWYLRHFLTIIFNVKDVRQMQPLGSKKDAKVAKHLHQVKSILLSVSYTVLIFFSSHVLPFIFALHAVVNVTS